MLPGREPLVVVVVARPGARAQVGPWLARFHGHDRHVVASDDAPDWELEGTDVAHHLAGTERQVDTALKLIGPVDVIVDLSSSEPDGARATWRRLYLHLRPGGLYVSTARRRRAGLFGKATHDWFGVILDAADPEDATGSRFAREMARSTTSMAASRDLIVFAKRQRHLVKLKDAETNRMIAAREPNIDLDVMSRLKAGATVARGRVESHAAEVEIGNLATTLPHPALFLRHYQGRIALAGGTLMYGSWSILRTRSAGISPTTPATRSWSMPPHVRPGAGPAQSPAHAGRRLLPARLCVLGSLRSPDDGGDLPAVGLGRGQGGAPGSEGHLHDQIRAAP